MKRHLIPTLAILLLVGTVPLLSQSPQPPGHLDVSGATATTGEVVSIDRSALVIRTDDGKTQTFMINAETVGFKTYPAGTRVKVDYVLDDQSRGIAKVIFGVGGDKAPAEPNVTVTETPMATEPAPAPEPEPLAAEPVPAPEPAPLVTEPAPAPEPAPLMTEPAPVPEPAPMVTEPAPVTEPEPLPESAPVTETAAVTEQETLPATASKQPLVGLLGLLALAVGLALHIAPRRS